MLTAQRERPALDTLEGHRRRIEDADRLLVTAIALRLQRVEELQAWKRDHHLPGEDLAQEEVVLRRARRWAEEHGADPAVVGHVLMLLISEGKAAALTERQGLGPWGNRALLVR